MSTLSQLIKHIHIPTTQDDLKQAQRLFHGRGHAYEDLHHVTVDWLPPVILVTLFSPETESAIKLLADELMALIPKCKSVQLQHRYQLSGAIDVIYGEDIQQLTIQEGDLHFYIHLGKTRNTGLFLDMKNGRDWVKEHSKNKRVLNLFAYTCGFSVSAIAGQAKSVLNIDMSSPAMNCGRDNHHLNHHSLDQVNFEKLNIFKSFGRIKKRGPFDLLICDPPTFQKGSVDIQKDYPKIMRRLDEFMAAESTLILCLNAPELGSGFLLDHMAKLAPTFQFIEHIKAPAVYVDSEGKGLKVLYFKRS